MYMRVPRTVQPSKGLCDEEPACTHTPRRGDCSSLGLPEPSESAHLASGQRRVWDP